MQLRKDKGKLYCHFVDFKGVFDSIDHNILWKKLQEIGLSSRLIKIVSYIYSKANVKISDGKKLTDFTLSIRVLQGETLSLLLFALFIYDLMDFLKKRHPRGLHEYCVINKSTVNLNKTNVLVFQK